MRCDRGTHSRVKGRGVVAVDNRLEAGDVVAGDVVAAER